MKLTDFLEEAQKVINLAKNMDSAFDKINTEEHLKLAIAAGLMDSYNK